MKPMKPKLNRVTPKIDLCQSPAYAIAPLFSMADIPKNSRIWESACGECNMVRAIRAIRGKGCTVVPTDIASMPPPFDMDYFKYTPYEWDIQITNPPFSQKYKWLERAYELGKPFALLLPVETLGAARAQRLFKKYGIHVILMDKRINFKMPNKGWDSHAQFPTAWFTWELSVENATKSEPENTLHFYTFGDEYGHV